MNSVDKALFVHDQIAKDTSYEDKGSNNSRLTEYGVLVKHKETARGIHLHMLRLWKNWDSQCISLIRSIWSCVESD